MPVCRVSLDIPAEEFVRLYEGSARYVVATDEQGRTVRFTAGHLRRFVTAEGVRGRFEIEYGPDHRFRSIRRLDPAGRL